MEKLNVEQKAKAYDELIKRLKDFQSEYRFKTIEKYFPELKESEDEKMRKELIMAFKSLNQVKNWNGIERTKILVWLEKQGEPTDINPSEFDLRLNKLLKQFETLSKEELTNSLSFYLNVVQNDGTYIEEKQGEQKPVEVESKFKVGDIIINKVNGAISKINKILTYEYELISFKTGNHLLLDQAVINGNSKLWTIQDAKDGDVLATENFIFIFKNIDNGNGVHYYCHYEINKHEDDSQFGVALPQSLMGRVGNSLSHYSPATKEQRDALMKAMADAGYTFDFEKKELKKIENKNPLLSDFFKAEYERGKADAQRTAEWSGEDCNRISSIKYLLHELDNYNFDNWLDSLKGRFTLKPTKEQMDALDYYANSLCTYCDRQDDLRSLLNVLKKL